MVHSGHCLTHENNRDPHFTDHENAVKGHNKEHFHGPLKILRSQGFHGP